MIPKDEFIALITQCMQQTISEMKEADTESLLRINDIAERFQTTPQTIHSWWRQGLITKRKIIGVI